MSDEISFDCINIDDFLNQINDPIVLRDAMIMENPPKVLIPQAYRPNVEQLHTTSYLDFFCLLFDGLSFLMLKTGPGNYFKLYPRAYKKKFPTKHFNFFQDINGHSYYIGKVGEAIDTYILFEPLGECECGNAKMSCVSSDTAEMIYTRIIRYALGMLPIDVLRGNNVNISVEDEIDNLEEFNCLSLPLIVFQNSLFQDALQRSCSILREAGYEFFQTHSPKMVFLIYGQNLAISNEIDVQAILENDFYTSEAKISLSVAVNVKYQEATEPPAPRDFEPDAGEDEYLNEILIDSPANTYSIILTENSIRKLYRGNENSFESYSKAFHKGNQKFISRIL